MCDKIHKTKDDIKIGYKLVYSTLENQDKYFSWYADTVFPKRRTKNVIVKPSSRVTFNPDVQSNGLVTIYPTLNLLCAAYTYQLQCTLDEGSYPIHYTTNKKLLVTPIILEVYINRISKLYKADDGYNRTVYLIDKWNKVKSIDINKYLL